MIRYLVLALWWGALAAAPLRALEVRQVLWGFDGRMVPGRIGPVSVLLANPGNGTFDGEIVLRETGGIGGHNGAPYVQPAFIGPQNERWVQFHVFVVNGGEDFALQWGRGAKEHFELERPAAGPPAHVLLSDPGNPFGGSPALKLFPDQLFPTTVAATDGLDAVVLDYVPRWEPARREAFVDWLKRGGTVLLLPATNGEAPVFTEQLAVLNGTADSTRVGAGTVLRAQATRREVSNKLFAARGLPAPELKPGQPVVVYNLEQTLFERLARMTRPNIRWWVINALTALYVLLVGPVHYRWGRRLDYRLSIGAFIACVGAFGWLFAIVGRRGYDESQTVHSLAIARSLGGARHDVTQWVSAFATRGDIYTLTHQAASNLYAVVSMEAVNGRIFSGKGGEFVADIPLYSSRQFVHRAVMNGDDTSVQVETWEGEGDLKALALKVGPAFPAATADLRARYRDRFYTMKREGDRLTLAGGVRGETLEAFLPQAKVQAAVQNYGNNPGQEDDKPGDIDLRGAGPLLYLRALDGWVYFSQQITRPSQPADRLELFILAKSPEGFRMQGKGFAKESGYVLYVESVAKP
ncbi:MAG: hypothetical protein QOE70_4628 [Chthoniobacter sp.]|jgi:hypothetical protein|nr:hypothetical protein [Chthoniobacter sp.]